MLASSRISVALLFLATGCASSWEAIDRSQLPTAEQHPEADAIVLKRELRLKFGVDADGPFADAVTRRRVLVLRPAGAKEASVVHSYSTTYDRVISARARILRPDGSSEEVGIKEFDDSPALGESLYQDLRVLHWKPKAVPVGTILEEEIRERSKDAQVFLRAYVFGGDLPTQEASFRVQAPEGFQIEHRATQFWQPLEWDPVIGGGSEGEQTWTWQSGPIAQAPEEVGAPGGGDLARRVSVRLSAWPGGQGFQGMSDYGRYLYQLQEGTAVPNPALSQQVAEILADAPKDQRAQARLIYEWVQANIRYVAIEVGIGGWRPHTAAEIFQLRYGDCKDKATLLKTMLQVAGIEGHLVEIYSHGGVPRRFVMPGIGNSNHAILAIELADGRVIADPTARTVPFGELPVSDQAAELLLIRADGGELITAPEPPASANRIGTELQLRLEPSGAAEGTVRSSVAGAYADLWRLQRIHLAAAQAEEQLISWADLVKAKASIVEEETQPAPNFAISTGAKVRYQETGTRAGDRLILRPLDLLDPWAPALPDRARLTPYVVRFRSQRTRLVTIDPGDGLAVLTVPPPVEVDSPLGRYQLEWSLDGAKLILRSSFELRERIIPPERYQELKRFYDQIIASESRPVVFGKQ